MRPWMKMLAVGGVVGATLSVGWAGERLAERRPSTVPASKTKRPDRLEFFSRGGQSAQAVDPATLAAMAADTEADRLAAEATSAPQRYVRKKISPASVSLDAVNPADPTKIETALPGTIGGSTRTKLTARSKSVVESIEESAVAKNAAVSSKKSAIVDAIHDVEELSPPSDDSESELDDSSSPEILPVNFETNSASDDAGAEVDGDKDRTGVIDASYSDVGSKASKIQKVSASQSQFLPAGSDKIPPALMKHATSARPTSAARSASVSSRSEPGLRETVANGTPTVNVEWVKRSEIVVGQECECELLVKNSGKIAARQVVVEAFFPTSVRLTKSTPEPTQVTDHLEWSIPELPAGTERVIRISMIPSQRGDLATTANVRFTGTAASVFTVEEPLLKLSVNAPADVVVGDPLVQTITVANPGTGVAQNVKLRLTLPEGLEHSRGDRSQIDVGALNPGETRTVRLTFTAIAGGEQTLTAEVTGDGGLSQVAESTVQVIAPVLSVDVEGSDTHQVGREARFQLTVTNAGQAATDNVRVVQRLPKGFQFVKADRGGSFDASSRLVSWSIGHLEPDQSAQVKLLLQAQQEGEFKLETQVTSENGGSAKSHVLTKIEGSAILALEIHDLEDPIAVGQETAYEVRVSNSGSRSAENVGLTFELPAGLELVNVESATQHLAKKGLVLFDDLPKLQPGKTALYRIHVRAKVEGNQRVRARLTSESSDEEIVCEEQTLFSGE